MNQSLWIVGFGVIGVLCRYGLDVALVPLMPHGFPYVTLLINCLGSFAAGMIWMLTPTAASPEFLRAVMVGGLGGFTTFSAFSVQSLELIQSGFMARAAIYGVLSWGGTVFSAWGGFLCARAWFSAS